MANFAFFLFKAITIKVSQRLEVAGKERYHVFVDTFLCAGGDEPITVVCDYWKGDI